MSLDIVWIASEDLRTAGKDDALTPLIFCRPKDVVGATDIAVQQGRIKVSLRIGVCSQVNHQIHIPTCLLASLQIGHIERTDFIFSREGRGEGRCLPICEAEEIVGGNNTEKGGTNSPGCTS